MKLDFLLSNRFATTLFAASLGLAILPASLLAFPVPQWMQGGHSARVSGIAGSPDGAMIASSSEDGTVKLWSTNGTLLKTLTAQSCSLTAVAWSPDGTRIAAGGYYGGYYNGAAGMGLTYLWQASVDGQNPRELDAHRHECLGQGHRGGLLGRQPPACFRE